ncbi:MAG: oligosaccharide flippase family protein [Anaerolineales bacterium]
MANVRDWAHRQRVSLSQFKLIPFLQMASASFTGRLFKNSAWGMLGLVIRVILGVVQVGLMTRALSVEQYGILTVIMVFPTLVQNLAGFRTSEFVARYCTEALERGDPDRAGQLAVIGWTLDGAVGLAAFVIVLLAAQTYLTTTLGDARYTYLLDLYALIVISNATFATARALLQVFGRFDLLFYILISNAVLRLALVALVFWRGWGLVGLVVVSTVASIVEPLSAFVVSLHQARRRMRLAPGRPVWAYARAHRREFISFLGAGYVEGTAQALSRNADVVLLSAIRGPAEVGMYQVAAQIVGYTANMLTPMGQAILPDLQRSIGLPRPQWMRRLRHVTLFVGGLSLVGALAVYLLAPWMIHLVVGDKFLPAAGAVRIMIWSMVFSGALFWLFPLMLALRYQWLRVASVILSGASQIAFLALLVPRFGYQGAAWAFLLFSILAPMPMLIFLLRWKGPAAPAPASG